MDKLGTLKKIEELRDQYAKQRIDLKLGKLTDTSKLKKTRREIARNTTLLHAQKNSEDLKAKPVVEKPVEG